jgi:mannose-6-phosphate isomerase-like protein (cupin superfamily)
MIENVLFTDWKELVTYAEKGMKPVVLVEVDGYKAVIAGMIAGNSMPAHAEGPAVFHFLEGSGQMIVGRETYDVKAGATVVVPNGAERGITAETQLAFLAVRLPQ